MGAEQRRRRNNVVKKSKGASSMRNFYVLLAVVAVIGIAAIAWQTSQSSGPRITQLTNVTPGEAEGYLMGDPNAPVTIMEFADFECPACANWATIQKADVVQRLIETGEANLRFFDFPLNIHPNTVQAHTAAACAADQDRFWQMHDALFQGQTEWAGKSRPERFFERYARDLGLDVAAWEGCYESGKHTARILGNVREGERLGVSSTPTFVIGNQVARGSLPYDQIKALVDSARARVASAPADSATAQ